MPRPESTVGPDGAGWAPVPLTYHLCLPGKRGGGLMRATHTRSRRPIAVAALAAMLTVGATATMTASAAAPAAPPPINDNYLESLNLNKPGSAAQPDGNPERHAQHGGGDGAVGHPQPAPRPARADGLQRRHRGQDDLVRLLPQRQRARADPHLGGLRHGHGGHAVQPQDAGARKRRTPVCGQPAHGRRRTVRQSAGRQAVHDPDRRRRRSRRHRSSSCSTTSSNSSACRPKRRSPRSRCPPGCAL